MNAPVLRVRRLKKHFSTSAGWLGAGRDRVLRAVDDVSFDLHPQEILALVGESGCGKTTLGLTLMGLEAPTAGSVMLGDLELTQADEGALRQLRRRLQMVFQDPYESLNPLMTVAEIVAEPLRVHDLSRGAEQEARVQKALHDAGLRPVQDYLQRRPHELSGGQRQRVVIAAALALDPMILIADEPVSMLDVSIRAEVLNLLADLREERGISVVLITHDLSTAASFADRIAVMYLGKIVELGPTAQVLGRPRHPYTQALLSVVPVPNPRLRRQRMILQGEPPDPVDLPPGCRFHPRCPIVQAHCRVQVPEWRPIEDAQWVACHEA